MIIVGLTGAIGSGKTTFADFLAEQFGQAGHWESWQLIAEVAGALRAGGQHPAPTDIQAINHWLEPLPDIVWKICHKKVAFDTVKLAANIEPAAAEYVKLFQYLGLVQEQPELGRGPITESRKEDVRSLLQWLGGYLAAKCGGDIWYAEIIRRIRMEPKLELATIGGVRFLADAKCIKEANGLIMAISRPGWSARDTADPTERERSQIQADGIVYNDGTLDELRACARRIAADLRRGRLKSEYRAAHKAVQ